MKAVCEFTAREFDFSAFSYNEVTGGRWDFSAVTELGYGLRNLGVITCPTTEILRDSGQVTLGQFEMA